MKTPPFSQALPLEASQIPVIDISPVLDGSDIETVAAQIHGAASEIGFFYIKGHGIDPRLINKAFGVA